MHVDGGLVPGILCICHPDGSHATSATILTLASRPPLQRWSGWAASCAAPVCMHMLPANPLALMWACGSSRCGCLVRGLSEIRNLWTSGRLHGESAPFCRVLISLWVPACGPIRILQMKRLQRVCQRKNMHFTMTHSCQQTAWKCCMFLSGAVNTLVSVGRNFERLSLGVLK